MLTSQFTAKLTSGEDVPISWCDCNECGNTFMVPTIAENEPRYCCFCGIKFQRGETADGVFIKYQPDSE